MRKKSEPISRLCRTAARASRLPSGVSSTQKAGVSMRMIFLPAFCSAQSTAAAAMGVVLSGAMTASTPAERKVSNTGQKSSGFANFSRMAASAAAPVWLQPSSQFVPMSMRGRLSPPTSVLGNVLNINTPFSRAGRSAGTDYLSPRSFIAISYCSSFGAAPCHDTLFSI